MGHFQFIAWSALLFAQRPDLWASHARWKRPEANACSTDPAGEEANERLRIYEETIVSVTSASGFILKRVLYSVPRG